MEIVLSQPTLTSVSKRSQVPMQKPSYGLLNTSYKKTAKAYQTSVETKTVFGVKKELKYRRFCDTTLTLDAFVKLILFTVSILAIV